MSGIQNLGQSGTQVLHRQDLEAGPLGHIGNLRFKAGPGTTPRASAPSLLHRFGQFLSKLSFYVGASSEQRAQRFVLDQARDNSRRVGNLLGNLTGSPRDSKVQSRIAQGLARLGDLSGGDLSKLPGGKESLKTYLSELGLMDLSALRSGVLGDPKAREAVISRVEPQRLRTQASALLDQISAQLNEEIAGQVAREPLAQIRTLLDARPVDGAALQAQLLRLSEGLAMLGEGNLATCLGTLSDAEVEALQRHLHPGKLDGVKGRLPQIPEGKDAPSESEGVQQRMPDTEDTRLQQSSRLQQARTMLDRLSQALGQDVHVRVGRSLLSQTTALQQAITDGNRGAISKALFALSQNIRRLEDRYGALPTQSRNELREQVALAVQALRDPTLNPSGPLSRASLRHLDDHSLGMLRAASQSLRAYGLDIDRNGARAEGLSRVQPLTDRVTEGVVRVLRLVAEDPVRMPALMQHLRDLSEIELQRTQQLEQVGHFGNGMGADDRKRMGGETFAAAIQRLRDSGEGTLISRLPDRADLIRALWDGMGGAVFGLGDLYGDREYGRGADEAIKRISTGQHMLDAIKEGLYRLRPESDNDQQSSVTLPASFYTSLATQYGVRFDPEAFKSTLVVKDSAWASLEQRLATPINPADHPTRVVTLPVHGTNTQFSVSSVFAKDGVDRVTISLSVRGAGPNGQAVRTTWPDGVPDSQRAPYVGEALDALVKVAGPAAEPLTRLMNQQSGGPILEGLVAMGMDSPFKLEDGSVVVPGGRARLHFDLEKTDDGRFSIGVVMNMPLEGALRLYPDGTTEPVMMDRTNSWVRIRVTLDVSPDGQQIRMSQPPQFQHHFALQPRTDG